MDDRQAIQKALDSHSLKRIDGWPELDASTVNLELSGIEVPRGIEVLHGGHFSIQVVLLLKSDVHVRGVISNSFLAKADVRGVLRMGHARIDSFSLLPIRMPALV